MDAKTNFIANDGDVLFWTWREQHAETELNDVLYEVDRRVKTREPLGEAILNLTRAETRLTHCSNQLRIAEDAAARLYDRTISRKDNPSFLRKFFRK